MTMNTDGARDWAMITKKNLKRPVAIVLDGYVYSAPTIDVVTDGGQTILLRNGCATMARITGSGCMSGAYLAGVDATMAAQIEEMAYAVGLAFQVQDDILDLIGDEAVIGKPTHSDDKNHKITYVTVHGMEKARAYVEEMSNKAIGILEKMEVLLIMKMH